MAIILSLETSASHCSVAVSNSETTLFSANWFIDQSHSRLLAPLVEKGLECAQISMRQLEALAVGSGPGSYTGLRISTSTAKGICFGLNIPLIAIGSMENMASQAFSKYPEADLVLVAIDARRNEIYAALLNRALQFVLPTQAMVLGETDLVQLTFEKQTLVVGTGTEKTMAFFNQPQHWKVDTGILPNAETVGKLAVEKLTNGTFEDLSSFEPDYVKPVFFTQPKA